MKKKLVKRMVSVLASAMVLTLLPVNQLYVRAEQIVEEEVVLPVYQETSGTFGDNGGFSWSYDESTKTMTVTGEDSGLTDIKDFIPSNAKNIIFQDCIVSDSMSSLLSEQAIERVEFHNCDASDVPYMDNMFSGCSSLLSVDLSGLNTEGVMSMSSMFSDCSSLSSVDLSDLNTQSVTDMSYMFLGCSSLSSVDLSSFDTAYVTDMSDMFSGCSSLLSLNLSGLDTGNVTDMSNMFNDCSSLLSLNLSGLNTGNVTDMSNMFSDCSSLSSLNLSGLNTGNVTDMSYMFDGCSNLMSVDLSSLDTAKVKYMDYMFSDCSSLSGLNLSNLDTGSVTDMSYMFDGCSNLMSVDLSNLDTAKVTDMGYMFRSCSSLTSVDLSGLDTRNLAGMSHMFWGCSSLSSLDLSGLYTERVTSMSYMFSGCSSLSSLNLSGLNTGKVIDMSGMFSDCSSLSSLDLSNLDTGLVLNMNSMFYGCSGLSSVDLSGFDTKNVNNMGSMFADCSSLTSLDFSGLNTLHVVDMSYMFYNCSSLESLNLSGLYFSNVKDMSGMFYNCSSLESLNLNVQYATSMLYMEEMFFGCSSLPSLDMSNLGIKNVTKMKNMLSGCSSLAIVKTPYSMSGGQSIELPYAFGDAEGNRIDSIVPNDCGKTFAKMYTITYHLDGGTNATYNPAGYTALSDTIILNNPTKTGHTFGGWYMDKNYSSAKTQIDTGSIGNVEIYAKWIQNKVAKPTIQKSGNKVVISTATAGSIIYYTTDGSTPTTENGIKANSGVSIDTFSGHVKAIAVNDGYANSDMVKLTLFTADKNRNVSFDVKGVFGGRKVTFNSNLNDAKVYYSSTTSTLTTKDKCVNVGETVLFEDFYGTIYARTYKDGQWGNACRLILKIPVVNTPTISIDSNGYATIRTSTPSSYLYYTTDGSTPSMTNGKRVSSPYIRVYVGKGKTVKAIAVRSCFTNSGVATKR